MEMTIVGAGMVGGALARAWAARDHGVTVAVRDPSKPELADLAATEGIEVVPAGIDAVADADLVVLAVPAEEVRPVAESLGDLAGKIVIDPTNPIAADFSSLTVGTTTSNAEELADAIPDARVVKAFNTIGSHRFDAPIFGDEPASMFVAGDDADAKQVVAELAEALGFEAVDVGPLTESRFLEPLAMLWIRMTYVQQAGNIGFRLLRD